VCTSTNWLTLGEGSTSPGTTFDIHFRLIENGTTPVHVALLSTNSSTLRE
jgi:hypothetical protein